MLRALGDLAKVGGMLKQLMHAKTRLEEIKANLEQELVTGSAGGGMVTVEMNGNLEVMSVHFEPLMVSQDHIEMLETMVRLAVNDAGERAREMAKEKMAAAISGLEAP